MSSSLDDNSTRRANHNGGVPRRVAFVLTQHVTWVLDAPACLAIYALDVNVTRLPPCQRQPGHEFDSFQETALNLHAHISGKEGRARRMHRLNSFGVWLTVVRPREICKWIVRSVFHIVLF